jgi:hypothetical protein
MWPYRLGSHRTRRGREKKDKDTGHLKGSPDPILQGIRHTNIAPESQKEEIVLKNKFLTVIPRCL